MTVSKEAKKLHMQMERLEFYSPVMEPTVFGSAFLQNITERNCGLSPASTTCLLAHCPLSLGEWAGELEKNAKTHGLK